MPTMAARDIQSRDSWSKRTITEGNTVSVTFLNIEQVRQRTSLSKQEIYRRVRRGEFPKQVPIGPARVAWVETEVDEWAQKLLESQRSGG